MKTKFKSFLNEKLTSEIAKEIAFELGEKINKKLGGGAYGVAFSTKSGKVLKLTNDSDEFNRAYALSRTKYKTKYLINYYNVGRIISSNSEYSYYLLMDQVLPLSETERKIITNSSFIISSTINNDDSPTTKEDYIDYLKGWSSKDLEEIDIGNLYDNIVNIAKELKKHKMQSVDFHGGNVGWDKDRKYLIFFDIGGYMPKSYTRNNKKIIIDENEI